MALGGIPLKQRLTMAETVDAVKPVTDITGEIWAASEKQSSGIEQVNLAVNQMDKMTLQNAAPVQAHNINQAVGLFQFADDLC
ncbi:hypothetical protein [Ralstonia solanacearum]|uniref:Uncharacterized protein n=1 Tax=Ralstonia solanacearum TaxID=305 RepID=A0AAD0SCZ9_RALSL|nr:hypothetical protein CJO77_21025 [Ralstonia solanacearum]AXW55155.1 hypothetical protein CJO92_21035 [Ralstonia solanacearum]